MGKRERPTPLGALITHLRTAAGLSQYRLAQIIGVNRATLMRMENGTFGHLSLQTLNALARALDVDPEDLYDALWQDRSEPLPSPALYLRSKYHLNEAQIAELESAIDRITTKAGGE